MEDFLRCLMSEGVHAVHCVPLPEPEGALRFALFFVGDGDGVFSQRGSRGTCLGLEEVSLVFFQVASL